MFRLPCISKISTLLRSTNCCNYLYSMAETLEQPRCIVLSPGPTGPVIITTNKDIEKQSRKPPALAVAIIIIAIISFSAYVALIFSSNFLNYNKSDVLKSASLPCSDNCRLVLVESLPENLTFSLDSPSHLSVFEGWKMLIQMANRTIDIASFYWTLRGKHVFEHPSAWQGEEIYKDLLNAGTKRGIKIRIVQNLPTKVFPQQDTLDFVKAGAAEVRSLNFTHFQGRGILHTKMMLVDGLHFYLGSANFDWRSLTQVKELGTITYDCKCLAQDMMKIFEGNWDMGVPNATIPPVWPPQYDTQYNQLTPMKLQFNHINATAFISNSPPNFCPKGRTTDIDSILHVISTANKFVYVEVMSYSPTVSPHRFWPVIDDALRKVSLEKGVLVRMLVSWWNHSKADMPHFLRSLTALTGAMGARIEVKLFQVPAYTEAQKRIPYARVNHNKFIVTDNAAYIGTSNWSGDYFVNTAGIGYVINQTEATRWPDSADVTQTQMLKIFERDWNSAYAHHLPKLPAYTATKTAKHEL